MTRFRLSREVPAGTALVGMVAIMLTLAGCSAVDDLAYGRAEASYANPDDLAQARGEALDWLPADAREIERVASTRADGTESLLFVSAEGLAGCGQTDRLSAPTMEVDDAPDVYAIDTVALCGDWAVAEQDGTYYAWTPAKEADALTP